jgi:hypothetical protein
MDPFDAGLFGDQDEPLPFFRMVFELTPPTSGITFAQPLTIGKSLPRTTSGLQE